MQFSKRLYEMPESPIRKLVPYAEEAKKRGIKVYHLNIGDPDIKTPKVMINSLKNFSEEIIRYANSQGEKPFLEALLKYYHDLGFKDLSSENIIATLGGSEAIFWTMMAVCEAGDEIIVFEPFYANYNGFGCLAQVNLIPVTTSIENGFHLPPKNEIISKISSRTKGILICNPSNPTGTIYTRNELQILWDIAKQFHLFLLADEVYREFAYDGKKSHSLLNFTGDNLIVLDSLSKRYSLCGARLGCVVSQNKELLKLLLKYGQARLSAGFIDQLMASSLTNLPKDYFEKIRREYQARRDVILDGLRKIKGVVCQKPEGAFYLIAKLPVKSAEDFAKWLLTDFSDYGETIMVAPAAGFYATKGLGRDEIRLAYVINQKDLKRSMEILKIAIEKYNIPGCQANQPPELNS